MEASASHGLRAVTLRVVLGAMVTLFASRADAQRVEWMPGDTPEECISAGLLRTRILRAATDPIAQDLLLRLGVHHVGEEY